VPSYSGSVAASSNLASLSRLQKKVSYKKVRLLAALTRKKKPRWDFFPSQGRKKRGGGVVLPTKVNLGCPSKSTVSGQGKGGEKKFQPHSYRRGGKLNKESSPSIGGRPNGIEGGKGWGGSKLTSDVVLSGASSRSTTGM